MTFRRIAVLFVFMFAAISWPAMADTYSPSHGCTQPIKPAQFNDDQSVDMFNDAVATYKECIAAFADEHNDAADAHRAAASDAVSEWNTFINDNNLN